RIRTSNRWLPFAGIPWSEYWLVPSVAQARRNGRPGSCRGCGRRGPALAHRIRGPQPGSAAGGGSPTPHGRVPDRARPGPAARRRVAQAAAEDGPRLDWNWSSSVEPDSAESDDRPPLITPLTWSK